MMLFFEFKTVQPRLVRWHVFDETGAHVAGEFYVNGEWFPVLDTRCELTPEDYELYFAARAAYALRDDVVGLRQSINIPGEA